jgi:hypothetical protein
MIDIFQNGQNEELVKFYNVTRGHSIGELEIIFLLITTFGVYILKKNEPGGDTSETTAAAATTSKKFTKKVYKKEVFISHNQFDFIELSLEGQAVHFVCINKRLSCWITTACRETTKVIVDNLQIGRKHNGLNPLPVFSDAMQQKMAIKKFISTESKSADMDNFEIKGYNLVHWEDQMSAVNQVMHKEGYLYLNKSLGSLTKQEWRKYYFILRNDTLAQYKSNNDKQKPIQVYKINGEEFSGCRKSKISLKTNTIELILTKGTSMHFATKNQNEANDWLQCFCKIISLGVNHFLF